MGVRLYVELKKFNRDFGLHPLCINVSDKLLEHCDIVNLNFSVDTLSNGCLEQVVHSNSMDTFPINSSKTDESLLICNNQFDFVVSDCIQKDVRETQAYKDKETMVAVMRRYSIDQRFQYRVSRSNSK
ncbi:hypothetical protein HAX54_049767, partial [Datura stramonium]|nr:hypothetical protein [Datura stramonium]